MHTPHTAPATIIKPSKEAQKRHLRKMAEIIHTHRGSNQTALLTAVNPKIRGWANYYRSCSAKKVYDRMDSQLYWKMHRWTHVGRKLTPRKTARWRHQRYWQRRRERLDFCDGHITLLKYADTKIQRHTKVQGDKSPFDGDWTYWVPRLGQDPSKPTRVVLLLKRQHSRCNRCGLCFMPDDLMEVHHLDGNRRNQALTNLALLHRHCHDEVHRRQCS